MMVEKILVVFAGTWVENKLGLILPLLSLLMLLMVVDYISGMLAAKKEALEYPKNKEYGWSSKKSIIGIYKKIGYMMTIFAAVCVDYLLYKFAKEIGLKYGSNTIFGTLVSVWFVINEVISILENVGRMGTELPEFLVKVLCDLKKEIESKDEK